MAEKQCSKCGEVKPEDDFPWRTNRGGERVRRGQCSKCISADVREKRKRGHYRTDEAKERDRRRRSLDGRQRRKDERRARGEKVITVWDNVPNKVAQAAKCGKEYWPIGCRLDWPKAPKAKRAKALRPWNDPGLSPAEKWKLRYRLDPEFHAREYRKALNRKRARRKLMAEGTVTPLQVAMLRIQCCGCAYCGALMRDVTDRYVDHVTPVSRGGRHDWDNLAVVCLSCNTKKHARMPTAEQKRAAERQRMAVGGQLPLVA